MAALYARTFDEANLYMDLRPCECGEVDFNPESGLSTVRGVRTLRCAGDCVTCGTAREFVFELPAELPPFGAGVTYGPAGEPSRLLDAGEWLAVAGLMDRMAAGVQGDDPALDPSQLSGLSDDALTGIYDLLGSALAAVEEAAKFLPAGADRVPDRGVWTDTGRMVRELAPERLTRTGLAA